jgi:hypothetical protein
MDTEEYMEIYNSVAGTKPEERAIAVFSTFNVEMGEKAKELTGGEMLDALIRIYATLVIDDTKKLELKNKARSSNVVVATPSDPNTDNPILQVLLQTEKHFMYPNKLAEAFKSTEESINNLAKPLIEQKIIYKAEKGYYALTKEFKEKRGIK